MTGSATIPALPWLIDWAPVSRDDFYSSVFGVTYSTYMERPWLSRRVSRLVWGGDIRPYYESMAAIAELADDGTVVDCPCGAGPALRAVRPGGPRYVGVDLSPSMLRRARARAAQRGLAGAEFVEAGATDVPLPADSADLFLSYWGLHCFEQPEAAVEEAARVLAPGGRLVGSTFVRGEESLRQRLLVRPHKGDFGPLGTEAEVESWIAAAALGLTESSRSGPLLFFEAVAG